MKTSNKKTQHTTQQNMDPFQTYQRRQVLFANGNAQTMSCSKKMQRECNSAVSPANDMTHGNEWQRTNNIHIGAQRLR